MRNATVPSSQRTAQAARRTCRSCRPRAPTHTDWSPARVPGRRDTSAASYSFRVGGGVGGEPPPDRHLAPPPRGEAAGQPPPARPIRPSAARPPGRCGRALMVSFSKQPLPFAEKYNANFICGSSTSCNSAGGGSHLVTILGGLVRLQNLLGRVWLQFFGVASWYKTDLYTEGMPKSKTAGVASYENSTLQRGALRRRLGD